ncbi:hypothetical protein B9Q04_14730 [Candidatus Marsarchaeota G2 archaeon BE_D]|jgi:hypothetical protein|uniref:Uncharacterized protein n=1 Tax=Candidatus Marsarchaeota G2 archaeon BE_D TaxID=1978158 RepID=A0A2R6C779_9ARCH|nr:MAG: hypothetical protein B9Q04_14730 [Candidatus Marsarchaeota G2 archaeon BE_D]
MSRGSDPRTRLNPKNTWSPTRRRRLTASFAATLYWLAYAFSTGMLRYYPHSVEKYLAGIPNPNFFLLPTSLTNIYFASGVVWFPNGHIELALGLGPTATSIAIALLLGLNINATRSLKSTNLRLTGATSLLSALISGGCCSLPLLISILAYASSSAVLLDSTLYNLTIPVSMAVLALMTATYIYTTSRGTTKLGQDSESCCTHPSPNPTG